MPIPTSTFKSLFFCLGCVQYKAIYFHVIFLIFHCLFFIIHFSFLVIHFSFSNIHYPLSNIQAGINFIATSERRLLKILALKSISLNFATKTAVFHFQKIRLSFLQLFCIIFFIVFLSNVCIYYKGTNSRLQYT